MEDNKNYFLASVGSVEAFRDNGTSIELAFVSKTMTDTGLNDSVTADDIRAGQGAAVVARFYHDRTVTITLTDVMFKRDYIRAQLGASFDIGGDVYKEERRDGANVTAGSITVSETPLAIGGLNCSDASAQPLAWFTEEGKDAWIMATSVSGTTVSDPAIKAGKAYCVRYLAHDDGARVAKIMTDMVPEELHLVIHVPLYAGDACAASGGKLAGEVQFDIPRFRLDGNLDFAAAMSSNQTVSLAGAAMATSSCNGAELYTIRILYNELALTDEFDSLEVLDETIVGGAVPIVYGIRPDKSAAFIPNSMLTFTPALNAGKFVAGTSYTVSGGTGLTETVVVPE